jgi:hypothetical protein
MTLTIAASPSTWPGAVYLTITTDNPLVSLTRSDRNGSRPVRLLAAALPASGSLTFRDYEPALSGRVTYTAATAYGTAEATTTLTGQAPRFILPELPMVSAAADTVYDYAATRRSLATVHEVIGSAVPIVVQAKMGTRRGTLSIVCEDHAGMMALLDVFGHGKTVMFRQPEHDGMDMYLHAVEAGTVPNAGAWELTVSYVELAFPAGPVMDAGSWTFADLTATGDTFADVAAGYDSFAALLLNEPKP